MLIEGNTDGKISLGRKILTYINWIAKDEGYGGYNERKKLSQIRDA